MRSRNPVHDLRAAHRDAQRHARRYALRHANDVRLDPSVLHSPPLAGATHTTLHLVDDQQNAVPVTDPPQLLHKVGGSDHVSTLALHRLYEDCCHFLWRQRRLEQLVFDKSRASQGKLFRLLLPTAASAVYIRITNMRHSRHQRSKPPPLLRLRSRQRKSAHRASVKRSQERNRVL